MRPNWFFHQNETIKPVSHLLKIYFESVGRGANLILNLAPDKRGLIPENDVAVLKEWNRILSDTFAHNLALGAVKHGESQALALVDGNSDTYWTGDGSADTPQVVLELAKATTFNVVRLREFLPLGQRIEAFVIDFWNGAAWQQFAEATSIGSCRLIQTPDLTTEKVRLRVTQAAAIPAISELGLFYTLSPNGPQQISEAKTISSHPNWRIISVTSGSETAANAIDGDSQTLWLAEDETAEIVIDMGESLTIEGFTFLPRQDGVSTGTPSHYCFYISDEPDNWSIPVARGEFSNIKANPILQTVSFPPVTGRYLCFQAKKTIDHSAAVIADISVKENI